VNEKATKMECFMFQTLTIGAPALKNIFPTLNPEFGNFCSISALPLRFFVF